MNIRITNQAPDQLIQDLPILDPPIQDPPIQDPTIQDAGRDISRSRAADADATPTVDALATTPIAPADDRMLVLRGPGEVKVSTRLIESSGLFSALFSFLHLFEAQPKPRKPSEAPPE